MSFVTRYLEPALVERLNHLQLSARSVVEGSITGQHRSPIKGASVEFRQHRFYTPGDEPRRLDWRVLARTDSNESMMFWYLLLMAGGGLAMSASHWVPVRAEDGSTASTATLWPRAIRNIPSTSMVVDLPTRASR